MDPHNISDEKLNSDLKRVVGNLYVDPHEVVWTRHLQKMSNILHCTPTISMGLRIRTLKRGARRRKREGWKDEVTVKIINKYKHNSIYLIFYE